jgi:hypothetical protein
MKTRSWSQSQRADAPRCDVPYVDALARESAWQQRGAGGLVGHTDPSASNQLSSEVTL